MLQPDIFIGLVTHSRSKYSTAAGRKGAAYRLCAELNASGYEATVVIEDRDLWSDSGQPLSTLNMRSLARSELGEERRWRSFLRSTTMSWLVTHVFRYLRTYSPGEGRTAASAATRLLNIESAHIELWKRGIASGATVIVILEDDAECTDISDTSQGLIGLLATDWTFLNLSRSFTPQALGIDHLLKPTEIAWAGTTDRDVLRSSRPVTNTVCALAFRAAFLEDLLQWWTAEPDFPLLPIDWKLNKVLRQMVEADALEPDSALWIEPGPFDQRSLI